MRILLPIILPLLTPTALALALPSSTTTLTISTTAIPSRTKILPRTSITSSAEGHPVAYGQVRQTYHNFHTVVDTQAMNNPIGHHTHAPEPQYRNSEHAAGRKRNIHAPQPGENLHGGQSVSHTGPDVDLGDGVSKREEASKPKGSHVANPAALWGKKRDEIAARGKKDDPKKDGKDEEAAGMAFAKRDEIAARGKKDDPKKDGTDAEAAGMAFAKREQSGSENVAVDEGAGNERGIGVRDKAGVALRAKRSKNVSAREVPGAEPERRDEPADAAAPLKDSAALALEACRKGVPKTEDHSCPDGDPGDDVEEIVE